MYIHTQSSGSFPPPQRFLAAGRCARRPRMANTCRGQCVCLSGHQSGTGLNAQTASPGNMVRTLCDEGIAGQAGRSPRLETRRNRRRGSSRLRCRAGKRGAAVDTDDGPGHGHGHAVSARHISGLALVRFRRAPGQDIPARHGASGHRLAACVCLGTAGRRGRTRRCWTCGAGEGARDREDGGRPREWTRRRGGRGSGREDGGDARNDARRARGRHSSRAALPSNAASCRRAGSSAALCAPSKGRGTAHQHTARPQIAVCRVVVWWSGDPISGRPAGAPAPEFARIARMQGRGKLPGKKRCGKRGSQWAARGQRAANAPRRCVHTCILYRY